MSMNVLLFYNEVTSSLLRTEIQSEEYTQYFDRHGRFHVVMAIYYCCF